MPSSVPALRIHPVEDETAWQAAKAIRRQVFIEEQACPPEEEFDAYDAESRHLLGRVGEKPVATARWRAVRLARDGGSSPAAKLERFAVVSSARGRGYGRALVRRTIAEAERAGLPVQMIHAQAHLTEFYAEFGFETRGALFMEAGIQHVEMVRRG